MATFLDELRQASESGKVPGKIATVLKNFYYSFKDAVGEEKTAENAALFSTYLKFIIEEIENPYAFPPFHRSLQEPFDFYSFGLDLMRPLVDFEGSKIEGLEVLLEIEALLKAGENVIFLANHQTEPDPQAISLLLEREFPNLAREMIFVAGHRVTTDPLAVPLSKGRNLLCIYSKRRVEYPPEHKQEKLLYNQRTMQTMGELLSQGGKCIYVAPSGGRDRKSATGEVDVAPFDPQSVEMFRLMASQAEKKTHFFPLSLYTYPLLPPPDTIEEREIEERKSHYTPVFLAFGKEIDIDRIPGCEGLGKRERRVARATYIWKIVRTNYHNFFA